MSYVIKKDLSGKFRFNLKSGNGETILSSEGYLDETSARQGIASAQRNGPEVENYEKKDSVSGQPYFVLKAKNGEVLGISEMYTSTAARDGGIAAVMKNCGASDVKVVA